MKPILQTLHDYQALQQALGGQLTGWSPAELRPAQVGIEQQRCDAQQLAAHLANLDQASGWLLYPSELICLTTSNSAIPDASLPLSGELKLADKHIRLAHLGASQWQWSSSVIRWVDADQASHLLEPVSQQPTSQAPGALNYWRVWELDDARQLQLVAALFDGFEGDQS